MEILKITSALSALAQPTRLQIFRMLVQAGEPGLTAGRISIGLNVRPNTLSNNLSILQSNGLIHSKREGREIRYFAGLDALRDLLTFLLEDCCGGHTELCQPILEQITNVQKEEKMTRPFHVLFLCTGNSARSILAEAIMNREGKGQFIAYSAGSQPKGEVHPETSALLERLNFDPAQFRSKSWDEFAGDEAPELDFVFTVCDDAANETCPHWPGQPMSAHWGLPDPALVEGLQSEIALAFSDTYRMLNQRISIFMSLPIAALDEISLKSRLDEIGQES